MICPQCHRQMIKSNKYYICMNRNCAEFMIKYEKGKLDNGGTKNDK